MSTSWVAISRGGEIPHGAILGGRTSTDGEVYVGRNKAGEVGKINLDNGKMWNLWCHDGGATQEGEMLIVTEGAPFQWVPVNKGDTLPPDACCAGESAKDGTVYPVRNSSFAIGKLNVDNGKVANMWFHGDWFAKSSGDILVVGPVGAGPTWADQYKNASKGEAHGIGGWISEHKTGIAIAGGIAAAAAAAGGVAYAAGAFDDKKKPDDAGYKPSGETADASGMADMAAPVAPATTFNPANYNADTMCDGVRAGERVDWLCREKGMSKEDAVQTVMKEFPNAFNDWWKPDADCGGSAAQARAQWLCDNKGVSMDDAKNQVRNEFPDSFGGGGGSSGAVTSVDGKFPHSLSIEQTGEGPKLKFEVTPRNAGEVNLVAFHYTINDGASMNFDVRDGGAKYTHVTPPGGGYPTCPPGAKVSYWLAANVNGLIQEMPEGACPNPDARLYWTAP